MLRELLWCSDKNQNANGLWGHCVVEILERTKRVELAIFAFWPFPHVYRGRKIDFGENLWDLVSQPHLKS